MASGTGAASPSMFSQEGSSSANHNSDIKNLTALVQVLLGRVEALTQKVEVSCSDNTHEAQGSGFRPNNVSSNCHNASGNYFNNSVPGEVTINSPNTSGPREANRSNNTDIRTVNIPSSNHNIGVANNNQVSNQEELIPTMSSFLNNKVFFWKWQLEVTYLEKCIEKKVIQHDYPAGLVENSLFHQELIELFDWQGFEFLKSLINFYNNEIDNIKIVLASLEQAIKTHKDFFRYKYEYCRIYSSIEATMDKRLVTKKKKLARDLNDYSNNRAYPKPPRVGTFVPISNTVTFNDNGENDNSLLQDSPAPQPLRRSERLINNNVNNNNNNNRTNGSSKNNGRNNRNRHFNNSANTSMDNNDAHQQQGFYRNQEVHQTSRQSNRNQTQTRSRRRQRRR
ncbi:probable WRKY transcription factor protein 1 [Protopterus annectens]|uniref:probable WRKY transcription factor protein 1 n=1 Tax=Protopterus annectens TaxID=7888 RepID=UPI001CF9AD32|nr:probable WRKY transcription factor protein 1 [Protopterus annectens]